MWVMCRQRLMILAAGVSCMQMVLDCDDSAVQPLLDVVEDDDRPASEIVLATLEGKIEKQKSPTPKPRWLSPHGSAPASVDGPDITDNPDPSSCCTVSIISAPYNAVTASNSMCESGSPLGGGGRLPPPATARGPAGFKRSRHIRAVARLSRPFIPA